MTHCPGVSKGLSADQLDFYKINFFYYIRGSINVFRANTLLYFNLYYPTEHRVNLFFNGFKGIPVLAYAWFFEYNVLLFLIKLKLSVSFHASILLIYNDIVFINGDVNLHR